MMQRVKTPGPLQFRWKSARGFALLLVISSLVLMTIMAVSFLVSTASELANTRAYAQSLESRRYADLAVNLAIGQISAATSQSTAASPVSWASQPGMIRTWNASGNALDVYKLYSSASLTVPAGSFNAAGEAAAVAGWKGTLIDRDYNALWCDLNSPLTVAGVRNYPIMAPPKSLDSQSGVEFVDGFSIASPPGFSGSSPSPTNNPAPMPVQWMYVLKNGQIAAGSGSASSVTVPGATATNPVVARVAFWTDDESAKINLNTAGEGFFWDQPHTGGPTDWRFTVNPPVKGEWNCFPAHPASTSLSAVFSSLDRSSAAQVQNLLNVMSPRIAWGGSRGLTFPYSGTGDTPTTQADVKPPPAAIPPPTRRLLFSPAEAVFDPVSRTVNPSLTTNNLQEDLRSRSFFLTSSSRAPEETLFDTPRISIWPITWMSLGDNGTNSAYPPALAANPNTSNISSNPSMMAEEKLLAFASTYGRNAAATGVEGKRFFFQRRNSVDPNADVETIDRNKELIGYLGRLARKNIPGYGASLLAKYGTDDTNQIVVSMFDRIRSGINLQTTAFSDITKNYYYTPRSDRVGFTFRPGTSTVAPTKIRLNSSGEVQNSGGTLYRGPGRFPTISEVSLVFYAEDRRDPCPAASPLPLDGPGNATLLNPSFLITGSAHQTTRMGMVMLFEFVNPMPGSPSPSSLFAVRVKGDAIRINGSSVGFPTSSGDSTIGSPGNLSGTARNVSEAEAFPGPMFMFWGRTSPTGTPRPKLLGSGSNKHDYYPFFAGNITVDPNSSTFTFSGGQAVVELWALDSSNRFNSNPLPASPDTNTDRMVQRIELDLGVLNGTYKIPIAPRWASDGVNKVPNQPGFPTVSTTSGSFEIYQASNSTNTGTYDYAGDFPASNHSANFIPSGGVRTVRSFAGARDFNARIGRLGRADSGQTGAGPQYSRLSNTRSLITAYDTVLSVELSATSSSRRGDIRLLASRFQESGFVAVDTDAGMVLASRGRFNNQVFPTPAQHRHTQQFTWGDWHGPGLYESGLNIDGSNSPYRSRVSLLGSSNPMGMFGRERFWYAEPTSEAGRYPVIPVMSGVTPSAIVGDFSNGFGSFMDGAIFVKPDEVYMGPNKDPLSTSVIFPFYRPGYENSTGGAESFFSPSRQVPSAVIFGDLPTGVHRGQPWQTLLFNPNPAVGTTHDGFRNPPDHVWLDFFWNPVVEPYAISEPFATAGKININYEIMPFFGYVERATSMHALMKGVKIAAVTGDKAEDYKSMRRMNGQDGGSTRETRFDINIPETLTGFRQFFNSGTSVFRSASQICEMFLVPLRAASNNPSGLPTTLAATRLWWSGAGSSDPTLTGANLRQKPYNSLYPRITTKSNSFRIHWRVQVLRQSAPGGTWTEASDTVLGEFRGSTLVERYLDANDSRIPDYATTTNPLPLHNFYRWRVVSSTQFNP